ncbi:MAG: type II toxin-antitoxin system Phd/YefM family antitoxin [Caldilineaceae bacterium]
MTKIVSASEAKSRFGSVLKQAQQEEIIIKVHGEPEAVLISYKEYQQYEGLKEMNRRRETLEALQALRDEALANTQDLSEEEVYRLAGVSEATAKKLIVQDNKIFPEIA